MQGLPHEDQPLWWEALDASPADGLGRAVENLRILVKQRRNLAPSRLLQLADSLTGYTAVLANLPGAGRREADWSGFQELVRMLERGLQDTFSVVRRLRRLLAAEVDVPRPILEAGDAVTLMTVHRSKGLEWPVVFVADLARKPGGRRPKARMAPELGVAVELREDESGEAAKPALLTLLEWRAARAEEEEAKRILYVALTRARDQVLLTATEPKGGPLDLILPGLEAAGVPCEELAFDAAEAIYPASPIPEVPEGNDAGLWKRDPADLGKLAPHVALKVPQGNVPIQTDGDSWKLALEFVTALYPDFEPLVEALCNRNVPVPDPDGYESELTRGAAGTGHYAIMAWTTGNGSFSLVDAALPDHDFDQTLLRVNPDDIESSVNHVLETLRETSCVS